MVSHTLKRLVGPAFTAGGVLWIVMYGVVVIIGVQTGKLVGSPGMPPSMLAQTGIWFLPLSVLLLGPGLLGLFARLEGRSRGLGITGAVFTLLGMLMSLVNLLLLSGVVGNMTNLSNLMGGFGAMATTFGTAFLGGAVLRTRVLPRWMAWTLVIIGLVTVPILFATPLPIGPDWASDFLAFLLSGIAYTILGVTMQAMPKPVAEHARSTSVIVSAHAK